MNLILILFIAVGLAMDAFVVSITSGLTIKKLHLKHVLRIACFFGAFQATMPIIGWVAGTALREFISHIDHWIAFGLLFFIGCKMIYESTKLDMNERMDPLNVHVLFVLSIATSIDALGVGLGLSFLDVSIIIPALIIGVVTFLLSFLGVYIGDRFGHLLGKKIEIIGGLILIGIGIHILIEHLF